MVWKNGEFVSYGHFGNLAGGNGVQDVLIGSDADRAWLSHFISAGVYNTALHWRKNWAFRPVIIDILSFNQLAKFKSLKSGLGNRQHAS